MLALVFTMAAIIYVFQRLRNPGMKEIESCNRCGRLKKDWKYCKRCGVQFKGGKGIKKPAF